MKSEHDLLSEYKEKVDRLSKIIAEQSKVIEEQEEEIKQLRKDLDFFLCGL